MEFIDGEDLASLLKRIGYLPNEKALDIARQLVAGLSAAHERGVLHRDLKPANIMIDEVGAIKRRSGIPTRMRTRGRPPFDAGARGLDRRRTVFRQQEPSHGAWRSAGRLASRDGRSGVERRGVAAREHHVAGSGELSLFFSFASWALTVSGFMWVVYIALEPFVRRRWPHMLVSWTRAWSGAWRDPLVGRDVLIGCAAGLVSRVSVHLLLLASSDFDLPLGLETIQGTPFFLAALLEDVRRAIIGGLATLFLFFILRMVIRIQWMAIVAALVLTALALALPVPGYSPWVNAAIGLVLVGINLWVLVSFGLAALTVAFFTSFVFVAIPITLRSVWYASYGYVAIAVVAAIALYGFRTALGERPILRAPELSD